jgi:hypothetical protein
MILPDISAKQKPTTDAEEWADTMKPSRRQYYQRTPYQRHCLAIIVAPRGEPRANPGSMSVEQQHTLQFARVEGKCLGARWIARKDPQSLGS